MVLILKMMIFLKYNSDTFIDQQKKIFEKVSNSDSDNYLRDDAKDHQEASKLGSHILRNLMELGYGD